MSCKNLNFKKKTLLLFLIAIFFGKKFYFHKKFIPFDFFN